MCNSNLFERKKTMNNGDSFHNGPENLELQTKNMIAPPKVETPQETAEDLNLPPHQRPYVNIYDTSNRQTCTAGGKEAIEKARNATRPPLPEQRGYTNIYAQRVAERTEATAPSQYGNGDVSPYYGDSPAAAAYDAEDADDADIIARKNKFNLASMILGIASFAGNVCCLTCLTPITAILAIVFACVGRIAGKFESKGLVGFVMGIVYCALMILVILYFFFVAMLMGADESMYITTY
jgi:hypothetical protein